MNLIHDGDILTTIDGFDVINCNQCGYIHIMPLPSEADIDSFYGEDYYESIKPEMLSNYENSMSWFNQMYDDRFEIFESTIEGGNIKRVLDIGAGAGYFLKRAKERGWEYAGVEASYAACKYADEVNDITIINKLIENVSVTELGLFNAINISEVLEHVIDPVKILYKCNELLHDDGVLFVMVPNEYNALQLISNKINSDINNYWITPEHHYNYFNKESINFIINKAGFNVFKTEASFPIEFLLLSGINYVNNRNDGKKIYNYIKLMELNMVNNGFRALKRKLYENLASIGIGRDLMLYSKKFKGSL
jgi:2-polyprenyl-3-methyl-5-hydroxy-6-metoxy-1,4-benzoquinol methylase